MAFARGFSSSRTGFPASLEVASSSFCPNGSDTASTGRHREPLGQNVVCRIDIPVMADAALGADPFTHIKREVLHNMLTIMTHFTGGIPTVNKEAPCLPITQARGFTARSDKG